MSYRVLVLPDHRVLSLGALKKIDALVRAGATVLGPKPLKAVSLEGGPQGVAEFPNSPMACGATGPPTPGTRSAVGKGRVAWGMNARELLLSTASRPM